MRHPLGDAWLQLTGDPDAARIQASLTLGLLGAAFQQLGAGLALDDITRATADATRAIVDAARRPTAD
jgi:hypothetical protein